jgi:tetratricopeptide (TPR) repeat protein
MILTWRAACLISALLFSGVATAEPKQLTEQELTELATKVDKADTLFKNNKFEEALPIYQEAYNLTEEPTMLFSVAQCYRNLNKNQEAADNYRKFLASAPQDNELRPLAQQLLSETEAKIPKNTPKDLVTPKAPKPEKKTSLYFFIGAGAAGAAGAGFGVAALSSAKKSKDSQQEGDEASQIKIFLDQTTLRSAVADLCFVAAIGVGVAGVLASKKEKKEQTTLFVGPSQVTISVEF